MELETDEMVNEPVEIEIKYEGYIKETKRSDSTGQKLEEMTLPADISYDKIKGLSLEEIEKLNRVMPRTLGQAQRISGVNPSTIQALLIYIKGKTINSKEKKGAYEQ